MGARARSSARDHESGSRRAKRVEREGPGRRADGDGRGSAGPGSEVRGARRRRDHRKDGITQTCTRPVALTHPLRLKPYDRRRPRRCRHQNAAATAATAACCVTICRAVPAAVAPALATSWRDKAAQWAMQLMA